MRTKSTVISLKLTPTELEALRQLVCLGYYKSQSAAIREGLGLLFANHKVKEETVKAMQSERRIHAARQGKVRRMSMTIEL